MSLRDDLQALDYENAKFEQDLSCNHVWVQDLSHVAMQVFAYCNSYLCLEVKCGVTQVATKRKVFNTKSVS